MYCDETNLEEISGVFFVYGGISVEANAVLALSKEIDALRAEHRIPSDFLLKFNPGPKGMDHREFISIKQSIIELAIKYECRLFASFILHDVATSANEARRNEINRICYHFDCFLARPDSHGLVLIDRFEDKKIDHHLREKFSTGITGLPYTPERRLERIIGFHYAAKGQSHLCSVVDVVLGSLRFAVNAGTAGVEKNIATAETLLRLLSPLFFRENGKTSVSELGLFFSPKVIHVPKYHAIYDGLRNFLINCGIEPEQRISYLRTY
jgi:hypothetical protein